jgi:OOP family OmpA-OmpF porin
VQAPGLRARNADVSTRIAQARSQGALVCAPVELATAEAQFAFAAQELSEGNHRAAKAAVAAGEVAVAAALEKSPADRCAPGEPVPPPAPGDQDGDGIKDDVDECPTVPEDKDGYLDDDGCPEPDNDADGINDPIDGCPDIAEDKDGFEDDDGCPDVDNDGDGLADKIDGCPDVAEDKDGFEDDDGCPDCDDDGDGFAECPEVIDACPGEPGVAPDGCPPKYTMIVVTAEKIELKQTIFFDTKKAKIKPVSFPLLDEVAQALTDRPKISVRIEGHTDSVGTDKFNMWLSSARADAVRAYLIAKGIDAGRMVAQGFGESVPLADNRTTKGKETNRRVEFVITAQ